MAHSKVSDLTGCVDATTDDELYLVDVSEATDADKSKKVTFDALMARIVTHDGAVVVHDGDMLIA